MTKRDIENYGIHWDDIAIELSFIKQHKRYPISKKMLLSIAAIVFILLIVSMQLMFITFANNAEYKYLSMVILAIALLTAADRAIKLWRTLKFEELLSAKNASGNNQLISRFLAEQQILSHVHLEDSNIFMVQSREIDNDEKPQKEIMILIADNNRILINSHYSNMWWYASGPYRRSDLLSKQLAEWLLTTLHPHRSAL